MNIHRIRTISFISPPSVCQLNPGQCSGCEPPCYINRNSYPSSSNFKPLAPPTRIAAIDNLLANIQSLTL